MIRGKPRAASQAGFSLLEVLVALAVAGAVLVGLLRLASAERESRVLSRTRLEVLTTGQVLLGQWLNTPSVEPGVYLGDTADGRSWQVTITEEATAPAGERAGQSPTMSRLRSENLLPLYTVQVCCRWQVGGREQNLCLDSARTALR